MAAFRKLSNGISSRCRITNRWLNMFRVVNSSRKLGSIQSFYFRDLQIQIATEAQKRSKPDKSNLLLFGEVFSDHMFEAEWHLRSGWGAPKIVPIHYLQCHPATKVFHYGQALFEGMKAYKYSDGSIALFRPDLYIKRLLATTERAKLPLFDGNEFLECLKKLVIIDKDWIPNIVSSSLYIRPTFIATQNSLKLQSSNTAMLYVITCPVGQYFSSGMTTPISLLADPKYVRAWPGGVGDKKMASNYAPTIYAQKLAEDQGLQQVLWLNGDNHQISQVGSMNVFFVFLKGGNKLELATPVLDGTILPGVIRQSLLDLARQFNEFEVTERAITLNEIITANENKTLLEMFICGTATIVCPVDRIRYLENDMNIPTMERENPLYKRLLKALIDIQYGRVKSEWSVKIN